MAHVLAKKIREAIIQAALEGKITETLSSDTSPSESIKQFQKQKEILLKKKNMKDRNKFDPIKEEELPFEIPNTWQWIRINDIGIYKKGPFGSALTKGIFVPKSKDAIKVYEQKNAIQKNWKLGDYYIKRDYYETKMSGFSVEAGDIIVSCAGTIGETYIMPEDIETGIINQALMRMNIVPSLNVEYFLMVFDHILKEEAKKNSGGTAIKNIPPFEVFKAMPIPLPPVEEQARIVARVDELMAKIDEYEKLENELVELKKNFPGDMKAAVLLAAMQGKLTKQNELEKPSFFDEKVNIDDYDYDLPDNWTVVKMSSVSELYSGNSIPEAIKKSKYMGLSDGMNYIGTKDVGFDHAIDYENGVKIPFGESKFKIAKKGATLLCVEGGSAGKKMGIIEEDVCFGNKLCSFNSGNHLDSKFQYYVIQSPIFGKMFAGSISGMIGGVSVNKLKDMLIPLPPIEEQRRIVEKLDQLLPLCEELEKEIA